MLYIPNMKTKDIYIKVVLVLLGIATLGMNIAMIRYYPKAMLALVHGSVIVQTGIAAFAIKFSE